MDLQGLINDIKGYITDNNNGRITGKVMQNRLLNIINIVGDDEDAIRINELETDSKTLIDAINEINKKGGSGIDIVDKLPETGKEDIIYILIEGDKYEQYIWKDDEFVLFSSSETISDDEILDITKL